MQKFTEQAIRGLLRPSAGCQLLFFVVDYRCGSENRASESQNLAMITARGGPYALDS